MTLQRLVGNRTISRVLIDGVDYKPDAKGANQKVFSDALQAILDCQNDSLPNPSGWLAMLDAINVQLQATTAPLPAKMLKQIASFYEQLAELNFFVNPILREAWTRCINATSKGAGSYSRVGGKFKDKFDDVLNEIAVDFPALQNLCIDVQRKGVNKEHMVNKGPKFGGPQVDHRNLLYAGVPPKGSAATLSEFHVGLHALKTGTGHVNFNDMDADIKMLIEDAEKKYDPQAMGKLT